jgi:hypothetical protein
MPDNRHEDEKRRREAAHARAAEVLDGGREVAGRSMKQMVSVRLEAQLLKELRELAEQQGASISDVLREAAVDFVEHRRTIPSVVTLRAVGSPQRLSNSLAPVRTFGAAPSEEPQAISSTGLAHAL